MTTVHSNLNTTDRELDFRKVFVACLAIGLGATAYSQYWDNVLLSVLSPLVVMTIYLAIGVRFAGTRDRVEQFADSLYFLGFLFTLIALTFSLLAFRSAEVNINQLVANFAMALLTTVFGLTARIVIINFRDAPGGEHTLQDILDHQTAKLVRTANQISRDLESVSRAIVEQHKALLDEHTLGIESCYRTLESLSEKSANALNEIVESAAGGITQTLTELRSRLESSHFPEDMFVGKLNAPIARFAKKLDETGDLVSELQSRQSAIQESMHSAAGSFREFDRQIARLSHAVEGFHQKLDSDRGAREKLVELARTMSEIVASSTSLTRELHQQTENSRRILHALDGIVDQVRRIPAEIDVTASAIRQSTRTLVKSSTMLASQSGTVREQFQELSKGLVEIQQRFEGLTDLASRIDRTAQAFTGFIETLEARSGNLSGLEQSAREQLEMIVRHQQDLQRILAESRSALEAITSHFARAVEYVTEKLRA